MGIFGYIVLLGIASAQEPMAEEEFEVLQEIFPKAKKMMHMDACWLLRDAVTCSAGHVASLVLNKRNTDLKALPSSLGRLSDLTRLVVKGLELQTLPELGGLRSLRSMEIQATRLWALPKSLVCLQDLELLSLPENLLTHLGDSICQLSKLQTLILEGNQLASLPDCIGELHSLTKLNLNQNSLSTAPVGKLARLESLLLRSNHFRAVPLELCELPNLRMLDLRDNGFISLPSCDLPNLTSLDVSGNALASFPPWVVRLPNLRSLLADGNKLSALPESWDLPNVAVVSLRKNQLTALPKSFPESRSLRELYLTKNELISLPNMQGLRLEHLELDDNFLQKLPEMVALRHLSAARNQLVAVASLAPKTLQYLDLSKNRLSALPSVHWEKLRHASLAGNELRELPEGLKWETLEWLSLEGNQLRRLPKSIGGLSNLTWLHLGRNELTELPAFTDLKNLEQLHLQENRLRSLPETLGELKSLKRLYLQRNQLTFVADLGNLTHLERLNLDGNRLQTLPETSLPSLRRLQLQRNSLRELPRLSLPALRTLKLQGNELQSLPDISQLQHLEFLHLEGNRLTELPALGGLPLKHLFLQQNQLISIPKLKNFSSLEVLFLQENALRMDLKELCELDSAQMIMLHSNGLSGKIPACLGDLPALRVLTLHRNGLSGELPETLGQMPKLELLTLHMNFLEGSLPSSFTSAPSLGVLSMYSNGISGRVPPMHLQASCMDDVSFTVEAELDSDVLDLSCSSDRQNLASSLRQVICKACPETCQTCATASSRGPVLLLQSNRLSCALPHTITADATRLRSLSLVGNLLGYGSEDLPDWVHDNERQPFLYKSTSGELISTTMGVLLLLPLSLRLLLGPKWLDVLQQACHFSDGCRGHFFVLRFTGFLSATGAFLFILYLNNANYYECGESLLKTTLAYFVHEDPRAELTVSCCWALWASLSMYSLRYLPEEQEVETVALLPKAVFGCIWALLVCLLALPSVLFVVSKTLPRDNNLIKGQAVLWYTHKQAAFGMLLVDVFTDGLADWYSRHTGLRKSLLLMFAGLGTLWLAASVCAILLNEQCMRGWTSFWTVCNEGTDEYKEFNISLGYTHLLDPTTDLCATNPAWMSHGACLRSLIGTLAPLFLQMTLLRAFLQPVLVVGVWTARNLGLRVPGLYGRARVGSLLVSLCEMALLFGAFVPLLLPAVLLATLSSLSVYCLGRSHFGIPAHGDVTCMSQGYLRCSLGVLLLCQNLYAWSTGMHGASLLLLVALGYLADIFLMLTTDVLPTCCDRPKKLSIDIELSEMRQEGAL